MISVSEMEANWLVVQSKNLASKMDSSPLFKHYMTCGGSVNECVACRTWISLRNTEVRWYWTGEDVASYISGNKKWRRSLTIEKILWILGFSNNSLFKKLPLVILKRLSEETHGLGHSLLPWEHFSIKEVQWTDFDSSKINYIEEERLKPRITDPMIGVPEGYVFGTKVIM